MLVYPAGPATDPAASIEATTRPAQELRETPHVLQAGASESEPAVWRIMVCAEFTLRKASSEDARAIAVIQVQASRAAYEAVAPPGYFHGFTAPRRVAAWRTVIARRRDTEQIIVAEESGQIRGYAHFGPSRDPSAPPSTAELYSLVAPSRWRRLRSAIAG